MKRTTGKQSQGKMMLPLPIGTSSFTELRRNNQIYVDKTDLIWKIASKREKFFLARPRRFGKSLLISTFESLFNSGLRDFEGLKIESLWKDERKFKVVRLDFSEIKQFFDLAEFERKLASLLIRRFQPLGFVYRQSEIFSVVDQLSDWMRTIGGTSLVILIDEYDSPLTATINSSELFGRVRSVLSDFYAILKSNDAALRFLFITGITKFNKVSIFSELNNLSDLTLDPEFGTLLGYTPEETEYYFSDYLRVAEASLNLDHTELMHKLVKNYDGFCFDLFARHRVFSPWSVLNFLKRPSLGFQNYWFESGGRPSVLLGYMQSHILRNPEEYCSQKSIQLSELSGSSDVESLSDIGLLTQAGYLTIRNVNQGVAFLDYPNEEVRRSMALLYVKQLLKEKLPIQVGAGSIRRDLVEKNAEAVFQQLNRFFASIDYQNYPAKDESMVRAIVFAYVAGTGLEVRSEVHNFKGRSDLEVLAEDVRWIFEFKVAREGENPEKKLTEALRQIESREYGTQYASSGCMKIALVYSTEKRKFVKWKRAAE